MHSFGHHAHKHHSVGLYEGRFSRMTDTEHERSSEIHASMGEGWSWGSADRGKESHGVCQRLGIRPLAGGTQSGDTFKTGAERGNEERMGHNRMHGRDASM